MIIPAESYRRFYYLASCLMALLSIALLLPYFVLSTYGFPTLDDLVLYTRVKEDGLFETVLWFYNIATGRAPILFIHGGIVKLVDVFGGNPWALNQISSGVYFLLLIGSLCFFFKTLLPALNWPLAIALGALPYAALMTFHDPFNEHNAVLSGPASEQLWPMVSAFYGVSFAMYISFISCFVIFLKRRMQTPRYAFFICSLFFIYSMSHELTLLPLGVFLVLIFLLSLNFADQGQNFSTIQLLSRLKVGVALRPAFDRRVYILVLLAMAGLLIISALIQVLSPSVAARDGYWPARMGVLEAFLAAVPMTGEFFQKIFALQKPFLWLLFGFVFLIARTVSLRREMEGRNIYFLLVPVIMFFVILVVGTMASTIISSTPIPRVQHYLLLYAAVAVSCLAVFLANKIKFSWLSRWRSAFLGKVFFIGFVAVLTGDSWYRLAVTVAVTDGYDYSRGIAGRIDKLTNIGSQNVRIDEITQPPPFVQPVVHWADTELYFQDLLARSFGQQKVLFVPCSDSDKPNVCHYLARSELGPMPPK